MKVVYMLLVLCLAQSLSAQIEVKNAATFKSYLEYGATDSVPAVYFTVTVTNNTDEAIPDIDVSNRGLHLNFFVNGENHNPISMYNGLEPTQEDHLIHPGESDTYQWMWLFKDEWKLEESYGAQPIIHWTYQNIESNKIQIDIKRQEELKQ